MYYPPPSTTEECVAKISSKLNRLLYEPNLRDFDIAFAQNSLYGYFYCRRKNDTGGFHNNVIGWKDSPDTNQWIIGYEGHDVKRIKNDVPLATWQWLYSLMDLVEDYANYCFVP